MGFFDEVGLKFKKTGAEVKNAISNRLEDLQKRLNKRNNELDEIMNDKVRLRSYLVRNRENDYPHSRQLKQELPTEDHQRIDELCKRICLIEEEMKKLHVIKENLNDSQELELSYEEILNLGFGLRDEINFA